MINEDSFFSCILNTTNRSTLWVQHENPHTYLLLQDTEGFFALSFHPMCFHNGPKNQEDGATSAWLLSWQEGGTERLQTLLISQRMCISPPTAGTDPVQLLLTDI